LPELESLALLREAGVNAVEAIAVTDASGAVAAATQLGGPVALKLDADGMAHKSDLGAVALGLEGAAEVERAAHALLAVGNRHGLAVRGLLVEPMAPDGLELILGLRRDPQFGPVVLVGMGGTLTEVLDDVAIRLAPLDVQAADEMLDDLRARRIFDGVRGRPPIDRVAVAEMIVALARFGVDRPDVAEADLNPVIASERGAIAVDALVVLEEADDGR
jgi:acyl-CoA synthetase (NDP forming)